MKLSHFRFKMPTELIASKPSRQKEESKLMVVDRAARTVEHKKFRNLLDYFDDGDLLITNNTKVFPSRLRGIKEKTNAAIVVTLIRELNPENMLWDVVVEPARKIRIGNKLYFGENEALVAEVIDNTTSRGRTIRFLYDGTHDELIRAIRNIGQPPLPDELLQIRDIAPSDTNDYQTIYAKVDGGIAAPTAGLHFTKEMLTRLEIKGVKRLELTLHAGLGNFRDIEVEDLSKHRPDSEQMSISQEVCDEINAAKQAGRKICSVGTTTMKALETAVTIKGKVAPFEGWSNKFIFPPYDFSIADMMITNFHHPMSPQFIMVCTFADIDLMQEAYQAAKEAKYKWGTYGDAMLIV
ncbi:MAG: tRNA preQ1(34) S-adenosylmethionine ribosyltransferase-isomerase QueA [Bacteroidales bacterium]|nr:tRNA preQ1(34) S-adenosylmethionine ribosyltransferase-isomerase QueA [Bacteroidales bacterium]